MENFLSCSRILYDKDILEKAKEISDLKKIISVLIKDSDNERLFKLGNECLENKQIDEAMYFFKEAINKENPNYIYYSYIGRCYSYKKMWEKSIFYHTKALELCDDVFLPYIGLAQSYFGMKNYDKSIQTCNELLKIKPDKKDIYIILGGLYLITGQEKDAYNIYKKANELFPRENYFIKILSDFKDI